MSSSKIPPLTLLLQVMLIFRGSIGLGARLSKEEERLNLMKGCKSLEVIAIEVFNNFGCSIRSKAKNYSLGLCLES